MNEKNNAEQDWYRFAMMDVLAANSLNEHMYPKPLEIICYLSQQSAEKMIKGFLVANDVEPPKIHDLRRLCEICISIDKNFEELKEPCIF